MFMLRALGNYVLGDKGESSSQIIQVHGALYTTEKNQNEKCLWIKALLTVQATTTKHNFQLLIQQVFEEGQETDEIEDDLCFLLGEEMNFYTEKFDDSLSFLWQNGQEKYRFVPISSTSVHTLQYLESTFLQCIFERKFSISSDNATEEDLLALKGPKKSLSSSAPVTPNKTEQNKPQSPNFQTPQTPKQPKYAPVFVKNVNLDGLEKIFSIEASFFWFDPSDGVYLSIVEDVTVHIYKKSKTFEYYLLVSEGSKPLTFQTISPQMNPIFYYAKDLTMTYGTQEDLLQSWGFKIRTGAGEREFASIFGRCMMESERDDFSTLKEEDRNALLNSCISSDREMPDAEVDRNADTYDTMDTDDENSDSYDSDDEEGIIKSSKNQESSRNEEKNSNLTVGYKYDRSFVVRGNQIGVFKHAQDDTLEFSTNIKNIQTLEGKNFSPVKTMLHNQDTSMILMDSNSDNTLFKMDLNYGKVVEEWKVSDYIHVSDICPETKYAQRDPTQTLVGMSHNSIFKIDPRLAGNKQVMELTKQYQDSKLQFSCTATTQNGGLVVASEKGDVRLFNQINKNAKTHLPGFGDPIIGVDVTGDGKWILGTCKNYLVVIPTEIQQTGVTGFDKPMGQNKPVPKRLRLKPEHIATMGCQPSFTPARFNVGEDEETYIVTSSGPYVVIWNFRQVKAGHVYHYKIRKYSDNIVADNFRFGQHKNIVVTLPDDVTMVHKASLTTPQRSRLRDTVVNSPF